MLVELPDAASILTGLFIFLIGFIAIITYFKVKLYVNSKKMHKVSCTIRASGIL